MKEKREQRENRRNEEDETRIKKDADSALLSNLSKPTGLKVSCCGSAL